MLTPTLPICRYRYFISTSMGLQRRTRRRVHKGEGICMMPFWSRHAASRTSRARRESLSISCPTSPGSPPLLIRITDTPCLIVLRMAQRIEASASIGHFSMSYRCIVLLHASDTCKIYKTLRSPLIRCFVASLRCKEVCNKSLQ